LLRSLAIISQYFNFTGPIAPLLLSRKRLQKGRFKHTAALINQTNTRWNVESMPIERVSAAPRPNRLPVTSFHRKMMWLPGFVFF
jgi:hypothetical protein